MVVDLGGACEDAPRPNSPSSPVWRFCTAKTALSARVALWERAAELRGLALPTGVAYLMRTSGSTDKAKVVLMPREGEA